MRPGGSQLIFYGYERHGTVLGLKSEQCLKCGVTGPHQLMRKVWWASIFTIPFMPLWFRHGMACMNCDAWTGLPWRTMRQATRTGILKFPDRRRTGMWDIRQAAADENGMIPTEQDIFDPVTVNPNKGGADKALKLWPVAIILIVGVIGIAGALGPKPAPSPSKPTAHTCYAQETFINGCRYDNGTMEGDPVGTPTTCYFSEPLPTPDWRVYCP